MMRQVKSANGTLVYKTELLPELTFFGKAEFERFVQGKRFKRLRSEMKKAQPENNQCRAASEPHPLWMERKDCEHFSPVAPFACVPLRSSHRKELPPPNGPHRECARTMRTRRKR